MLKKNLLRGMVLALLVGGYFLHVKWPAISNTEEAASDDSLITPFVVARESGVAKERGADDAEGPAEITAGVVAVDAIAAESGRYTFSVTLKSPDTGCDAYANWWEVVTPEGDLLYRRILAHSHVDEQPFTRSGGPVVIAANRAVIVRLHMHPTGYSPQSMQGSVDGGFEPTTLTVDFAQALAEADPQPSRCAF